MCGNLQERDALYPLDNMDSSSLVIRGCYVIGDNTVSDETDIFVNNGVIQSITQDDIHDKSPCITDKITVIDAQGMYLMPGLIDCHVHLIFDGSLDIIEYVNTFDIDSLKEKAIQNMMKSLCNGITTVRDMGCTAFIVPRLKKKIQGGFLQGPRIFSAGNMITSKKGHVKTIARETDGSLQDIKKAVREQFSNDVDFIKLIVSGGLLSPDSSPTKTELDRNLVSCAVNESKRLGLKTAVHVYSNDDIAHAIDAGVLSIEHGSWASENTLKRAARDNVVLVPTLKASSDIIENADNLPSYMVKNASHVLSNTRGVITNAIKNKVKIVMGTDAGTPYNYHGDNAKELEYLSEYGVSNQDLIKAATTIPAQLLDLEHCLGSVKQGYEADLILLDANPLDDISALRKNIRYVISRGRLCRC